jgi:hypothetical protein
MVMFVGLIDTRDKGPEKDPREPLWLDLPELRPWPWFVATLVGLVAATQINGWPGLIPLFIGFGCFLRGVSSYYKGNDGLSKHRQ